MKRGNYLWIFVFIIIILIFVKAFVSTDMMVVSPVNTTYNESSIELNWSVDEDVIWCAYNLDGGSNNTGIYSKNITQISTAVLGMNTPMGVKVMGDYAYVVLWGGDNLTIINISDKNNPSIVSSISNSNLNNAHYVDVVGDYAYIGSEAYATSGGLTIINVSDKISPVQMSNFSNASSLSIARSIYVLGDYAYVPSISHDVLTIINISNKTNATQMSSFLTSSIDHPLGVYVLGDYAYITAWANNSLTIINVSDKTAPALMSYISNSTSLLSAFGVVVVGNYAYVVTQSNSGLTIIDISDKINPVQVSSFLNNSAMDECKYVRVAGDYAYITAWANESLTIINVSDKTNPNQVSFFQNSSSIVSPEALDVFGGFAYVPASSGDKLVILDIMNLKNQTLSSLSEGLHNVTIFCKNSSENLSQSNYTFFSVDTTSPVVSFSCSPTSVYTGDSIACSCSATDIVDSSPSVSYEVNPLTSLTGVFTTSCTATDFMNYSASSSIDYTVESSGDGGGDDSSGNGEINNGNGGSEGGNGGGSSSGETKLEEVKFIIYAKLKQGESKMDDFTLTNIGTTTLDINLNSDLGFLEFEKNLSLDSKKSKDIKINISVKEDQTPYIYNGYVYVSSYKIEQKILVVVEVISKDSLFNISLEADEYILPGDEISADVFLEKIGEKEENVLLNYLIKDEEGGEIVFYNETRIAKTSTEFVKKIKIPEETKEGGYIFYVQLIHEGRIASDSSLFNVGEKVVKVDWLILFLVVVLVILLIIWIRNMIRKGKKKLNGK